MTRVLGSLLLLLVGLAMPLLAPQAGAKAVGVEQRLRGLPARTNWTWLYRIFGIQVLIVAALVALGILRLGS